MAGLEHQLAAPLHADLTSVPEIAPKLKRLEKLTRTHQSPQAETFLAHLTRDKPDLELLEGIKLFAKNVRDQKANPLCGNPATVLYYAAIAAAFIRYHKRISSLSHAEIREGCRWAMMQPGAEALVETFRAAVAALSRPSRSVS